MATYETATYLTILLITSLLALPPATSFEVVGNSGSNDGHGGWGYLLGHEPDSNPPCTPTSSGSAPGPSDWGYGFHDSPDGRSGQFGYGYSSPDGRWSGGGGGAWSGGGGRDRSMVQGTGEKPHACSCDQTVLSPPGSPTISSFCQAHEVHQSRPNCDEISSNLTFEQEGLDPSIIIFPSHVKLAFKSKDIVLTNRMV